jgi:hypothetical protein
VRAPNTLHRVADVLCWQSEGVDADGLSDRLDDHLDRLFGSVELIEAVGPSVIGGMDLLGRQARRKFLRAPQVVAQLVRWRRHRVGLDPGYLSELVLAELASASLIKELPMKMWTARGEARVLPMEKMSPWLIDGELALEDKSPQTFPYDGTEQKLLLWLNDEDAIRVRAMLNDVLGALSEGSTPAYRFVRTFLRQVSARFEPGDPDRFNSSSFSQFIGLALLINPHLSKVDVPNLTEALVHESIHSMLFMIEEIERPFLLDRSSLLIRVKSPWSGALLNLNAYLHACLVWYGLFWLWTRLFETEAFPPHRCLAFKERARAGFAYGPLSLISEHLPLLSEGIVELIETVEARMRQFTRNEFVNG